MKIKLRAWDLLERRYLNQPLISYNFENDVVEYYSTVQISNLEYVHELTTSHNSYIEQYIGLVDINNVEIYEGDIVKSTFNNKLDTSSTDTYIVKQDTINPCFVLHSLTNKNVYEYDFNCVDLRTNEVIGNIRENPELIPEYVKLKKDVEDGKILEYFIGDSVGWSKVTDFNQPIAKKENFRTIFKKDTWVNIVRDDGVIFDTVQYDCSMESEIPSGRSFDLWKPTVNDYCFFYNKAQQSARLGRFKQMAFGEGRKGKYKDTQGNYYTCCEPFVGTLPNNLKIKD